MQLIYFSHSYREPDAGVVECFGTLMRDEGLTPSLDPPSDRLNSAKPERHLRSTDGMIAVLTSREKGVSPYILYEVSLCLRAQKPLLVFVEDVLPDDILPYRVLQRRFSRKGLLRQLRDHRHAIKIFKTYVGEDPPPSYQPDLRRRSCLLVGVPQLAPTTRAGVIKELELLQYTPEVLDEGGPEDFFDPAKQETISCADVAVCFLDATEVFGQLSIGALRAFLTPTILLTSDSGFQFHPSVPREYQPRIVEPTALRDLRKTIRTEIDIFEEEYVDLTDPKEVARYTELLIREASPVGQYSDDLRRVFVEELVMGDKYQAGQAGAMGPGAQASHMTFNQIWAATKDQIDLSSLAAELSQLREAMKADASEPEEDIAVGAIAQAENAANAGNGPTALEHLKNAGKWALDCATKIGTTVAAAAIKAAMGL
ncbi:hypothetical protein ACFL4G_11115 [Thermodesulfobacteriota bacterium]